MPRRSKAIMVGHFDVISEMGLVTIKWRMLLLARYSLHVIRSGRLASLALSCHLSQIVWPYSNCLYWAADFIKSSKR